MSLKTRTIKGISWSAMSQITRTLLILGITTALARLLNPNDFGLIAMVAVFANFFVILDDMGLPAAIIYKKRLTEGHLSSGFWLNILEGLVLTVILAGTAPFIAHLYSKPQLTTIIIVMSTTLFISSFGMLQGALLAKQLSFRLLAITEITATVLSSVIAITLAALGFGVWSLVAQSVSLSLFTAVLLFIVCKWKPKLVFEWKPLKELLAYGMPLLGYGFASYFSRNMDNLLVGKYLGSDQLGDYAMSYRFCIFPWGNVTAVISRVMFPAMSTIQEDHPRLRNAYMQTNKYIAAVTFPMMAGLIVVAPAFVRVALGPNWKGAIVLIQILAAVGLMQSITSTARFIYQTQGRTVTLLLWGTGSTVVFVASFIIGLHWNVRGVAAAYLIASAALFYPNFAIPFRMIELKFWKFMAGLSSVVLATAGMVAAITGLRMFLERWAHAGDTVVLVAGVSLGIVVYLGLIAALDRGLIRGLFDIFRELRSGPTSEEDLAAGEVIEMEPDR